MTETLLRAGPEQPPRLGAARRARLGRPSSRPLPGPLPRALGARAPQGRPATARRAPAPPELSFPQRGNRARSSRSSSHLTARSGRPWADGSSGVAGTLLIVAWAAGSSLVLAVSAQRIRAFERLVRDTSTEAPELRRLATEIAQRVGLRSVPVIRLSSARLSPLTWWLGGEIRVILPSALVRDLPASQLRWVLAHEFAHVKRRDHLVRWLEWLACVSFWWNPVVWWARRDLRLAEEVACDALVVRRLGGAPRSYARALLAVVELLAGPSTRSPSMATGIAAADTLEWRFRKIVSQTPVARAPTALIGGLLVVGLSILAVGVGPLSHGSPRLVPESGRGASGTTADRGQRSSARWHRGRRRRPAMASRCSARSSSPSGRSDATRGRRGRPRSRIASSGRRRPTISLGRASPTSSSVVPGTTYSRAAVAATSSAVAAGATSSVPVPATTWSRAGETDALTSSTADPAAAIVLSWTRPTRPSAARSSSGGSAREAEPSA